MRPGTGSERPASLPDAYELEQRLYRYLAIPAPGRTSAGPLASCDVARRSLQDGRADQLRGVIGQLERSARAIGGIPTGYPRHIALIMRLISAVLPWYTRSLVEFGQNTTQAAAAISKVLEEVIRRQELMEVELARMRQLSASGSARAARQI